MSEFALRQHELAAKLYSTGIHLGERPPVSRRALGVGNDIELPQVHALTLHSTKRYHSMNALFSAHTCSSLAALGLLAAPLLAGDISVIPLARSQACFGSGFTNRFDVVLENSRSAEFQGELSFKLSQVSASTVLPLGVSPWKSIRILPSQRVLESMPLQLPHISAPTSFLVQWLDTAGKVLGKTSVQAFPTNLLSELSTLSGNQPLGLRDPTSRLKPLLKSLHVDFTDIEEGMEGFSGKLAIVFPEPSASAERPTIEAVKSLAARVGGVVLLEKPAPTQENALAPFRVISVPPGCIVIAAEDLLGQIAESPRSQLDLLQLARIATRQSP